jgi:hypothetical protein
VLSPAGGVVVGAGVDEDGPDPVVARAAAGRPGVYGSATVRPRCSERNSWPAVDAETSDPALGMRRREMRRRSVACSHTGRRGHEVRPASITSA